MGDIVIKVEDLSKQYRLGKIGTGSFSHDFNRWWHRVRGKEDPYSKIGEVNDRSTKGTSEYVWSLRDVSFNIEQGDAVGIIGRNGAGKSTLLKILSRTTAPTSGKIGVKGRVASLLEVGTGFHPELTGRENIFLNGAILGMTRKEIRSKFDEIVDFAGVERYIDTPVKRYSSGMYVRLAFGVAAHLEPDILVVDEVLAVGDAEFQKKALGKMQNVSRDQGRTVLFVSHNMPAVKALCSKGIVLENGSVKFTGDVESAISAYNLRNARGGNTLKERKDRSGSGLFRFVDVKFLNNRFETTEVIESCEEVFVDLLYELKNEIDFSKLIVSVAFTDIYQNYFTYFISDEMGKPLSRNANNRIRLHIPSLNLRGGEYQLRLFAAYDTTTNFCDVVENAAVIEVQSKDFWKTGKPARNGNAALVQGTYLT